MSIDELIKSAEVDHVVPSLSRVLCGVAARDITPPIGIQSNPWGKSESARSTGVHHPLMANAMLLKGLNDDGRELFLVTLDIGWIGCYECDVINFRTRVVKELGIDIDDLLVNLSQTHKGPPFCIHEATREGAELVPAFIENVITSVIAICQEARTKAGEVDITWAYGKCDLANVRDLPIGETDFVGYNPNLVADDTLTVARVTTIAGEPVATLANYGCHPTTLGWECDLISPDFVGQARKIVETKTGAPFFYLQGACGNLGPREQYVGDPAVADRNGEILGYATLATLAKMFPPASEFRLTELVRSGADLAKWTVAVAKPSIIVKRERVTVRMKHKVLLSEEQMRANWHDVNPRIVNTRVQKQLGIRLNYVDDDHVNHPVWLWQIGNAIMVAHCGEAYFEMQQELRRRHLEHVIMFMDMTNGPGYVYIPTRSAYARKAYQSWQTILAPGSFEEMVEFLDKSISTFLKANER
ncbi:MAG: hypothetical protein Q8L08_07610 [Candidatus Nanopelagicaceae bacterium]|nr:hypothetical protein [Candidatus Nanopelagicaceae bacterium]